MLPKNEIFLVQMDQQTFAVSPNMSCSLMCARRKEPSNKNKPDGRQREAGCSRVKPQIMVQQPKKKKTTTMWCMRLHSVRQSEQHLSQKCFKSSFIGADTNKKNTEPSGLPADKVLGAASHLANSRHSTSLEWCDYVWSGAWRVAAPLRGWSRATNPRPQD